MFEKRLIEAYISENGKDPVTGEDLTVEDLIDLKTSRIVRPRPPTLTSIPSLLSTFQNEWDALALETYTIRQHLAQTRQELSTALYQNDAASRVIRRLTQERDEARDALSKVSITAGGASNGDQMQIDSQGLPEALVEKVDATQEKYGVYDTSFRESTNRLCRLSKGRRKRATPKDWATSDSVASYTVTSTSEALYPGGQFLTIDPSGESAVVGGSDGVAGVFSLAENKLVHSMKVGGAVTDAVWYGSRAVVASTSGAVKVFDGSKEVSAFSSHAGAAKAIALHPCGDILASVGVDKSFVFYDLVGAKAVSQIYTDSGMPTNSTSLLAH